MGLGQSLIEKMNASQTINIAMDWLGATTQDYKDLNSSDKKVSQKAANKIQNGNGNPFKKGTYGYEQYEYTKNYYSK